MSRCCVFAFLVGEVAEVFLVDVGDGYGGDFLDGDDDAEVFLVAFDDTFHSGKDAFGDLDLLAWLAGELEVVEEDDLVVSLADYTDEIVHALVGDIEDFGAFVVVLVIDGVHDVAEGFIEGFVPLDVAKVPEGDADEDVVDDGRCEVHTGGTGFLECQGQVGFFDGFFLVEPFLQGLQQRNAGVVDAQGKPVGVGVLQHRCCELRQNLGVTTKMECGDNGRFPSVEFVFVVLIESDMGKTTFPEISKAFVGISAGMSGLWI